MNVQICTVLTAIQNSCDVYIDEEEPDQPWYMIDVQSSGMGKGFMISATCQITDVILNMHIAQEVTTQVSRWEEWCIFCLLQLRGRRLVISECMQCAVAKIIWHLKERQQTRINRKMINCNGIWLSTRKSDFSSNQQTSKVIMFYE